MKKLLFLFLFLSGKLFSQDLKSGTYISKNDPKNDQLEGVAQIKITDQTLDFEFQVKNITLYCDSKIKGKAFGNGKISNNFYTFVYEQMAGKIEIYLYPDGKMRTNFINFLDLCFTFKPENEWVLQNRQSWIDKFVLVENTDDLISSGYANNIEHGDLRLLFQEAEDEVFLNWKEAENGSTWKAVGKYVFKNGITAFVVAVLEGNNEGDYIEHRMLYVMNKSGKITDKKMIVSDVTGEKELNDYIVCESFSESGANGKIKVSQGILNSKTKIDEGTDSTFEIGADGKLKQISTKKYKQKQD